MAYTLVTANSVYPAQQSYQQITLTGNIVLNWPSSFGGGIPAVRWSDVSTAANGYTITLPDATLASEGTEIIFNNLSIYTFNILKNDGTLLLTVAAGQVVDFLLNNSSTSNGIWDIIPYGGGTSGIAAFTAASSDNSVTITNGVVVGSGATINFQLPTNLYNFNTQLANTGFPVITATGPLTWAARTLIAGNNISITNGSGVNGNPVINVNDSMVGLTSIAVGNVNITGSTISAVTANTGLTISSNGAGALNFNGATIDANSNATVNNLTVSGTFNNALMPKAWCMFTDSIIGGAESNVIVIHDKANITSITGAGGAYTLTFTTPLSNNNYGVLVTIGTDITGPLPFIAHGFSIYAAQTTTTCRIAVVDASGEFVSEVETGVTVAIFSSG